MRVAIDQSTIDDVARAIDNLGNATSQARSVVYSASTTADNLKQGVDDVKREFAAYKEYDRQQKNLQNAKAEIVKVRMELEEKFGINVEIRRYLTGILEASDLAIVKKDIISNCTERMMLDCKEYWLAPCLIALAAWLADNKELADRALTEAMRRDDERTSLLFALICRRVGRPKASVIWLERYLAMQDPHRVERKLVTVLDAYANGLFGQEAKDSCTAKIEEWIAEMSAEPGFVEKQQAHWEQATLGKMQYGNYSSQYRYSGKYVTNWKDCEQSLNETGLHHTVLEYFQDIFEKKSGSNLALSDRLDQLLENYLSSYDNAELPLRRKERELELIIEHHGNVDRAMSVLASEQAAMEETLDFTQLLTSAAMHADVIHASNATQRLAVALSKNWIISAYENIILKIRSHFPGDFKLSIEGWEGTAVDGTEEADLSSSAERYFIQIRDKQIEATKQSKLDIALPIILAVCSLFGFASGGIWGILLLLAAAGCALRWHLNKKNIEKQNQEIYERFEVVISNAKELVKAICAERVDYVVQLKVQDDVSDKTLDYIKEINAVQYVEHGQGRSIH